METTRPELETIKIERVIPARRWRVLRLITAVQDFPSFMPNVKECRVVKRDKESAVTQWQVVVDELPIRWKQEDRFDRSSFTIAFKAIEGDLDVFEGRWILKKDSGGEATHLTVEVKAKLGIPIFDKVIKDTLSKYLHKNFEMMLKAIEENLLVKRYQRVEGRAVSSTLNGFVVMGHPYNVQHLMSYFKVFKPDVDKITPDFLLKIFELAPTFKTADIKNYRSKTGATVNGSFVLCPIIPDMALLSPEIVLPKVIEGCRIAERLGAGVLALGGFTSIVGEKYFDQLKSKIKIPITTGNAYTAAMALEGIRKACSLMEVDLSDSKITIVGGTGDIGSACARVLVKEVKEMTVTGRTPSSLASIQSKLMEENGAKVTTMLDNNAAILDADIIIAAASSTHSVVDVNKIKSGAIVCDVGYPKNIGRSSKDRDDIFVFAGGLSTVPQPFDVGFDVGLPSTNVIYGCFAEAIILSLEGRYENFSEGKGKLMPEKLKLIKDLADKHGFQLAPFYSGHDMIPEDKIKRILSNKRV